MKNVILLIFSCITLQNLIAQECPMQMGMNLYSNVNWSREMPFANLMFQASIWVTQNQNFVPEGINAFDTEVLDSIEVDGDGYPLSLPQKVEGTEAPQSLLTLLIKDNGGIHPDGNYTLTYEGQGEVILVGQDVSSLIFAENNKRVYHIVVQSKGDIGLKIISSEISNPVHNIKVMLPEHDETEIYNKAFIEKIKKYKTIRFMNWQRTNGSDQVDWDSRPSTSYYTINTSKGVPLEYLLELSNLVDANIWINIPHQANEDYVKNMAGMIKSELKEDLKVYLEYSNEVWNDQFAQHQWVNENAPNVLLSPEQKYAYFTKKAFAGFTEVFIDDLSRIVRVLSGQQANPNVINRSSQAMKDQLGADLYDAISCTGSLSFTPLQFQQMDEHTTVEEISTFVRKNINELFKTAMQLHKTKADSLGKGFVAYESTGLGSVSYISNVKPSFADAIGEYNRDTALYNIYTEWLKYLRDEIGMDLCCSFVLADDNEANYGSYGHLNSIYDAAPYPPAYQAISDINCDALEVNKENYLTDFLIYPNPAISIIYFGFESDSYQLYDINGKLVASSSIKVKEIDISKLTSGIYFVKFHIGNKMATGKVIKI